MNGWGLLPGQWVIEGLCGQADPDLWHPDHGQNGNAAKIVCRSCPVQVECLTWALDHGETHGVWGGTSHNERRQLGYRDRRLTHLHTEDWHGTSGGIRRHQRNNTPVCTECRDAYNTYHRDLKQQRKATS